MLATSAIQSRMAEMVTAAIVPGVQVLFIYGLVGDDTGHVGGEYESGKGVVEGTVLRSVRIQ